MEIQPLSYDPYFSTGNYKNNLNTEFAGLPAEVNKNVTGNAEENTHATHYSLVKNQSVFIISIPNTDSNGSHDKIYDQILSTFKFIDQVNAPQANNPPVVVFIPDGLFSPDLKTQIQQRIVNPYLDYSNNAEQTVSLTISVNNNPSKSDYPYLFQAVTKNSGSYGLAISMKNGLVNYWLPECMGPCNLTESFKTKYPEITKLIGQ